MFTKFFFTGVFSNAQEWRAISVLWLAPNLRWILWIQIYTVYSKPIGLSLRWITVWPTWWKSLVSWPKKSDLELIPQHDWWLAVNSDQCQSSRFFWGGDITIISFLWTHAGWKRLNNSQHLFLTCIHCTCLTDLSDVGVKTYQNHSMPHWTTAEPLDPLDKNRLRILLPTLGFLSAIGRKYGNYERGFPQVLTGLVLNGFIWWGFCRFILEWY